MKYTDDNMMKLARKVVDDCDMDILVNFAIEQVFINYKDNECDFKDDLDIYDMK